MIQVTLTASNQDDLDSLLEVLKAFSASHFSRGHSSPKEETIAIEEAPKPLKKGVVPALKAKPVEVVETKPVKLDAVEVRSRVAAVATVSEANTAKVREIIASLGASNITQLDPSKYEELLTKVEAMK